MTSSSTSNFNKALIRQLWDLFSSQQWSESRSLFHQDFVATWPQSCERFIGVDNFIDMNQYYPGNHTAKIKHLLAEENKVVCTVYLVADTGQTAIGTSFFEMLMA